MNTFMQHCETFEKAIKAAFWAFVTCHEALALLKLLLGL
jgi:hypothetical protein